MAAVPTFAAGGEVQAPPPAVSGSGPLPIARPGPALRPDERLPGVLDAATLFRIAVAALRGEQGADGGAAVAGGPPQAGGPQDQGSPEERWMQGERVATAPPPPAPASAPPTHRAPAAFVTWLRERAARSTHPVAKDLAAAYRANPGSVDELYEAVKGMAAAGEDLPDDLARLVTKRPAAK
jgi:hypothetical protein